MRLIILTSFLLLLIQPIAQAQQNCFSEIDSIEFGQSNNSLDSRAIISDKYGNYYIGGGGVKDTILYRGALRYVDTGSIYLFKFDQDHNLIWSRKGSKSNDLGFAQALAIDNQNNIIAGGYYEEMLLFGNDTLSNQDGGAENAFISKFQPDGTHLWSKRVHTQGVLSTGRLTSLSADAQGNIYFGGIFNGTLIFGKDTIQSWGINDNYWGKMNSSGTVQWVKAAGGNSQEYGAFVAAGDSGSLYVTGSVDPTGNASYVDDSIGHRGGFITKYSSSGQKLWLRGGEQGSSFTPGKRINEKKIAVQNGTVVVTGSMSSNFGGTMEIAGVQITLNHELSPAFVLKLDTMGTGIWLRSVTSLTSAVWNNVGCEGLAITVNSKDNISVLTSCDSTRTDFIIPDSTYGAGGNTIDLDYPAPFLVHLNGQTGQITEYCYPGQPGTSGAGGRWWPSSMTNANDSILVTGSFSNEANGNNKVFIFPGNSNPVGIEEEAHTNASNVDLYPNPNTGAFTIELPETMNEEANRLNIFRVNGQPVFSERINSTQNPRKINVQLPELPQGIYFLSIEHDQGIFTKKILIQ